MIRGEKLNVIYKQVSRCAGYLLMDLTKSEAEGWRIRSRKSCQVSGAVDELKTSPLSISTPTDPTRSAAAGEYYSQFYEFFLIILIFVFHFFLCFDGPFSFMLKRLISSPCSKNFFYERKEKG